MSSIFENEKLRFFNRNPGVVEFVNKNEVNRGFQVFERGGQMYNGEFRVGARINKQ